MRVPRPWATREAEQPVLPAQPFADVATSLTWKQAWLSQGSREGDGGLKKLPHTLLCLDYTFRDAL